jgi:phenylalanyl-tRNA synthetase beta chain
VTQQGEFVVVGWAGELHPTVIEAWELPSRACAVELDLDTMIGLAPTIGAIKRLGSHPATKQDLAVVVDDNVAAAEVAAALRDGAGELLESVTLFDLFTGIQIGDGLKSLAFNLVFRASDRTLTEAEASQVRANALAEAHRRFGAVIRS